MKRLKLLWDIYESITAVVVLVVAGAVAVCVGIFVEAILLSLLPFCLFVAVFAVFPLPVFLGDAVWVGMVCVTILSAVSYIFAEVAEMWTTQHRSL